MIVLNTILAIVIALLIISGAFVLFGTVVGVTFGVFGAIMGAIWNVLLARFPLSCLSSG
ncbi:MAG: hypothetical protein GX823_01785 [Clostridiales bacterium]|nr:hypothetical protein [Clostridiales bacterium]